MSKNFVFQAAVEGGGARLGFSWVKNFVEVSSLTKITKFLPHENYTLYGTRNAVASSPGRFLNRTKCYFLSQLGLGTRLGHTMVAHTVRRRPPSGER